MAPKSNNELIAAAGVRFLSLNSKSLTDFITSVEVNSKSRITTDESDNSTWPDT
jgi:hypothetical protein